VLGHTGVGAVIISYAIRGRIYKKSIANVERAYSRRGWVGRGTPLGVGRLVTKVLQERKEVAEILLE